MTRPPSDSSGSSARVTRTGPWRLVRMARSKRSLVHPVSNTPALLMRTSMEWPACFTASAALATLSSLPTSSSIASPLLASSNCETHAWCWQGPFVRVSEGVEWWSGVVECVCVKERVRVREGGGERVKGQGKMCTTLFPRLHSDSLQYSSKGKEWTGKWNAQRLWRARALWQSHASPGKPGSWPAPIQCPLMFR